MPEPKPLPATPDDVPAEFYNDERFIRNALCSLQHLSSVDMHFEGNVRDDGDADGEWVVDLQPWRIRGEKTSPPVFQGSHKEFLSAFLFAFLHLQRWEDTRIDEREEKRKQALALRDRVYAGLLPKERALLADLEGGRL